MFSRPPEYQRPAVYAQEPSKEHSKADRQRVRFADCNECAPKDPNYAGCSHPEDADDFHPGGGPAAGRVDHQKPAQAPIDKGEDEEKKAISLADLSLGDLFASADTRIQRAKVDEKLEKQVMLRNRALQHTLFMNVGGVAKSIVLFTNYGLEIGSASDKDVRYGGIEPRHLTCILALTYRSATTTLTSGFNVLYPTNSDDSSLTDSEVPSGLPQYINTDQIQRSVDPGRPVGQLLPLPILRQNSVENVGDDSHKIISLVVACNTRAVAVEYLCENLLVGVVGCDLDKFLPDAEGKSGKVREIETAGEEKTATDKEKERLLGELEDWTGTFAGFLRQELKGFRMEIKR